MSDSGRSDEQLMEAYLRDDPAAFAELFRRWAPRLRRLYLRAYLPEHEAADLVQQCFLQLHRARNEFDVGSRLQPWLCTIAINLRRQSFRRRRRKPEVELEPEVTDRVASSIDPDAPLVAAKVHAAIAQLDEPQREAIVLHWFHELTFQEIAARVAATTDAVKVRAHRGYVKLRAQLEAMGVTASELHAA